MVAPHGKWGECVSLYGSNLPSRLDGREPRRKKTGEEKRQSSPVSSLPSPFFLFPRLDSSTAKTSPRSISSPTLLSSPTTSVREGPVEGTLPSRFEIEQEGAHAQSLHFASPQARPTLATGRTMSRSTTRRTHRWAPTRVPRCTEGVIRQL